MEEEDEDEDGGHASMVTFLKSMNDAATIGFRRNDDATKVTFSKIKLSTTEDAVLL